MSNSAPNATFTAATQINPAVFVTNAGEFSVSQSVLSDMPIGVSELGVSQYDETYAAAEGEPIGVWMPGQECYLTLGSATVNVPSTTSLLMPDANGNAILATSGYFVGAYALENGTAGAVIKVRVGSPGVKA